MVTKRPLLTQSGHPVTPVPKRRSSPHLASGIEASFADAFLAASQSRKRQGICASAIWASLVGWHPLSSKTRWHVPLWPPMKATEKLLSEKRPEDAEVPPYQGGPNRARTDALALP